MARPHSFIRAQTAARIPPTAAAVPTPRARSHVNRFLIMYLAALVALAGLGYWFSDYHTQANDELFSLTHYSSDLAYIDLPRVNVTLPGDGTHPGHLRMDISIEVEKKYAARVESYLPRISEKVNNYVNQLSFDEINKPAAAQKMREYLLEQVNQAGAPVPIMSVVFRQYVLM